AEMYAPGGFQVAIDRSERRHARIRGTGGDRRRRVVYGGHAERQLAWRPTRLSQFRFHFAQQEPIGSTRVAGARQALILHDIDADLIPRSNAWPQRDYICLVVRIRTGCDHQTVARLVVRLQAAVEVEVALDCFVVVNRQPGPMERVSFDGVLPGPGELA